MILQLQRLKVHASKLVPKTFELSWIPISITQQVSISLKIKMELIKSAWQSIKTPLQVPIPSN